MNGYSLQVRPEARFSTGNDIVALLATQPEKTNLPRFYSRILTVAEQQLYDRLDRSSLPFDHYTWLCWSIKESAYKFNKRNSPDLVFSPLKITISELSPPAALPPASASEGYYRCKVSFDQEMLFSYSLIRDGVVVTVVSEDEQFTDTHWGFQSIGSSAYACQSSSVRTFALQHLGTTLSRNDLQLQKDQNGCPIVLAGQQRLDIPLSLAHHDTFVAWSFMTARGIAAHKENQRQIGPLPTIAPGSCHLPGKD
jgi:phosphopantetheinyl transferase (holo-ACP synthase)